MSRDNMAGEVFQLGKAYDHIVIDGPPRAERIAGTIMMATDMVVMPIVPSAASIWAAKETVEQLRDAKVIKQSQKSAFLVTRKIGNSV